MKHVFETANGPVALEVPSIAVDKIQALEQRVLALGAENERLRKALGDALEAMQDMRGYVSDYFARKWGHDDAIQRTRRALEEQT